MINSSIFETPYTVCLRYAAEVLAGPARGGALQGGPGAPAHVPAGRDGTCWCASSAWSMRPSSSSSSSSCRCHALLLGGPWRPPCQHPPAEQPRTQRSAAGASSTRIPKLHLLVRPCLALPCCVCLDSPSAHLPGGHHIQFPNWHPRFPEADCLKTIPC